MPTYLVRHAKAGSRRDWEGPDECRPLTAAGRLQAAAIAERLRARPITRLLSSPYLRCVQTLEPLAKELGLVVECDDDLAEGSGFEPVLKLLDELPDHSALCSHGDVIPETLRALERRGLEFVGLRDTRKGSIVVLERDDTGRWARATSIGPPEARRG
jgi:8-oxo-dGTP diphosphatase